MTGLVFALGALRSEHANQLISHNKKIAEWAFFDLGAAVTGTGTFYSRWYVEFAACCYKGRRILPPTFFVKIDGQQKTGLVQEHGIETHDEITTPVITSGEMPADDLVRDRQKSPVWANSTFNPSLIAEPLDPFIGTGRLITAFAGFTTFKSKRINILKREKKVCLIKL